MNQILEFRKQKPALSSGNPSEKISLAGFHRWQPSVKLQQKPMRMVLVPGNRKVLVSGTRTVPVAGTITVLVPKCIGNQL